MKYYDFDSWFKSFTCLFEGQFHPEDRKILMEAWEAGWQAGKEFGETEEAIQQAEMRD